MRGDLANPVTGYGPAPDPTPRRIGFPAGAGLIVAISLLVTATFGPWLDGLSGWDLLSSANDDVRVGLPWWVVVLVPVTVVLGVVALLWPRRPTRLPLVAVTGVASLGMASLGYADLPWPGWGLGLALFAYPAAFVCATVLWALPWRTWPALDGRVVAVGSIIGVGIGVGIAAGADWYGGRDATGTTASAAPAPTAAGAPGQVLWRARVDNVLDRAGPVVLANGIVAFGRARQGDFLVTNAATGTVRWRYSRPHLYVVNLAASRDGRTLIALLDVGDETRGNLRDTLIGFDALTGAVRWQWWPNRDVAGDQIEIRPDVIIGARFGGTGTVVAVDPVTGRQLWLKRGLWAPQVNCGHRGDGISVASDGHLTVLSVFCADTDRVEIRAVDRSGTVRWTQSGKQVAAVPISRTVRDTVNAVTANAVVVYREASHEIEVLDPATGHRRWAAPYDKLLDRMLDVDGSTMLIAFDPVAGNPTQLQLRDLATGALRPAATGVPSDSFIEFPARAWQGHVYLLANERRDHVTAVDIDMTTGTVAGTSQIPSPEPGNLFATPVVAANAVAMDQGYALFDLNGKDGKLYETAIALGPSKH